MDITPLVNYGALGLVCAWLMLQVKPELREVANAMDRNSRALMLFLSQQGGIHSGAKEQAKELLTEVEIAMTERSERKK